MTDGGMRPMEAVRALRSRGVDDAESLLEYGTPEDIVATCHWWDSQRKGKGLLVWKIKHGGVKEEEERQAAKTTGERLRALCAEYTAGLAIGAAVETHANLNARRWPDDADGRAVCDGRMVITEMAYPVLAVECDRCGFTAAVPIRAMPVLFGRDPIISREESIHNSQRRMQHRSRA
jgi:hypothetical protein